MRTTVYLRVGKSKDRIKVEASPKPSYVPLKIGQRFIPTVAFGVEFDIPDELFKGAAAIVGLMKLTMEQGKIATHIKPKIKP